MQSREKFVLNNLDRREYRKIVAEKLKDVEFNQDKRIKLNEEELEYLLFDIDKTGKPIFKRNPLINTILLICILDMDFFIKHSPL